MFPIAIKFKKIDEMENENRVTLERSNENNNVTIIFLFGTWDVRDVGCLGCGM